MCEWGEGYLFFLRMGRAIAYRLTFSVVEEKEGPFQKIPGMERESIHDL
jgi:hypothetical protein